MGEPITAKRVYKALFTKEDGFNFHKFFGLFALLNFIYRFRFVGPSDMNFKTTGLATPVCFFMHAMLSASSLIFKIPIKRIAEGSRIWPEYRLHSIIFAYRSLACLLVTYLELKYGGETRYYLNGLIVVGTLLAADFGTWWVGPAGRSSTIQGLDAPPFMRYFFSVMQFHATAGAKNRNPRTFCTFSASASATQNSAHFCTNSRACVARLPHRRPSLLHPILLRLDHP